MNEENDIIEFDLELYINILSHFGMDKNPALRIYKIINDKKQIKTIARKAVKQENFIGKVSLKDQWKAASKLLGLNIISREEFYNQINNNEEETLDMEIFIRSLDENSPRIILEKMITDQKQMNFISKKALSNSFFIAQISIGNMQRAIDIFASLGFIKSDEY